MEQSIGKWCWEDCKLSHTIVNCEKISQIENKNILQNGWQSAFSGRKLSNKGFYRRLCAISAANDTTANNIMYHSTWWLNAEREADKTYETFSKKYYFNALSDVEVVYFVEKEMADPSGKVKIFIL